MDVDVTTGTTTGREYRRVSYDKSGRERSNAEQADDNRRAWPGWEWAQPYSDHGSASRYARRARDDFDQLISDLAADRFGADVLVLWENSRGSRKVSEWCTLLELCEERGVRIAITTHDRIYDPANPRDVRSLLDDANDSQWESAKTSMRVKRATVASAQAGRPSGRVPYGYKRTFDPNTGRLVGQEIEPAEADVVAEMFDRIVKGHTIRSIARDLAARGIGRRKGGDFSQQQIRTMLRNPLYMGKKVYVPGRRGGHTRPDEMRRPDAVVVDAIWPPIVSDLVWWQVQAILEDPARNSLGPERGWRPGGAKHLLSMIARCDVCSSVLSAITYNGRRIYKCAGNGHVKLPADDLDALAVEAMLAYLSREDHYGPLSADDQGDDELEQARAEVARIRAEHDELTRLVGTGQLSPVLAAKSEPAILARLRDAEAREQQLATPSALRGLIQPGEDVAARWEAADISTKREVARLLLAPDALGELRVTPHPKGRQTGTVPARERVHWRRDED